MSVDTIESDWGSVISKIRGLKDLQENWDSYGAPKIDPSAIGVAELVAVYCLCQGAFTPNVVPTACGGVQLEWHLDLKSLEVRVNHPDYSPTYFYLNHDAGEICESELYDIVEFNRLIKQFVSDREGE